MDIQAAQTAARRARKAYAHAARQLAEASTERARSRHARRIANARRALAEATRTFEGLALEALD